MNDKKYIFYLSFVYIISRIILSDIIYVFDDAFITFRYAENFTNGYGLIYNLSENFLGVSTPLYALFCGFISFLNINLPKYIFVINSLFELLSILILIKLLSIKDYLKLFSIFSIVILSPYLFRITLGGMESNLFFLLSLQSIYLFKNKKYLLMTIIASINCFIRPEGFLLVLLFIIFIAFSKNYKELFKCILSGIIIGITGLLLIYYNYNTFIPQSISAKATLDGISYFDVLKSIFWKDKVSLFLLLPSSYYFYKNRQEKIVNIIGLWLLSFVLFYLISKPLVWTWYCYSIWMIISISGVLQILDLFKQFNINRYKYYISLIPIIFSLMIFYKFDNNVKKNVYLEIDHYFKDFKENQYTIYANDIGAIGYYSKQYIYDSESLVHNIANNFNSKEEIVKYKNPDFLFINNTKFNFELLKKDLENYIFERAFSKSGRVDFPENHPEYWNQDYLLYKRKNLDEKRN